MQAFQLAIFSTLILCIFGANPLKSRNDSNLVSHQAENRTPVETLSKDQEFQGTKKVQYKGFSEAFKSSAVTGDLELSSSINNEYCKLGGHLEFLSIHCPSEKISNMKNIVSDIDQAPHTKWVAMIISSVAVGCKHTAEYLTMRLLQLSKADDSNSGLCNSTVSNAPLENTSTPCDPQLAKDIRDLLKVNGNLTTLYDTSATPLFLTLGCHNLGLKYFDFLKKDLDITTTTNSTGDFQNNSQELNTNHLKNDKSIAIMRYINTHKSDVQNIPSVDDSDDLLSVGSNDTSGNATRRKRSTTEEDIDTYFKRKEKCSIVLPLGATVQTTSKIECLQLCLEDDSCKSVGYTKDQSQICQLNTETEKDAGPLFRCGSGESSYWEYFERKKDTNYFIITWKTDGRVLQAMSATSINIQSFNGDDSQYWFWEEDAIRSKKYATKVLDFNYRTSNVYLHSFNGGSNQRWNYDNGDITSQYNNFKLSIKKSNSVTNIGLSENTSEKWTLSLDRFYFIITNRQSGKVLDVYKEDCATGKVVMWSYHGGDNQLWFWEDENIRSKKCPGKVLDLHMRDYNQFNWGKVYLHPFNGGNNQKWTMENDNIISRFKDLRLDVKSENKADGAIVGGYIRNSKTNQEWTLGTFRTYFFILNKNSGKVMDASSPSKIVQRHYYKGDNQLWFWDADVIRSKKYVDKVIDLHMADYTRTGWGKIYLHDFNRGSNQRWIYTDQFLISRYQNLSVEVSKGSLSDNALIGGQQGRTEKWSLNPEHDFFTITSRQNAKVFDAPSDSTVTMWSYNGKDHQLWFWDEHSIRSKKYPSKVLDLHWHDYEKNGWGKVYLHSFNGGDNQKWQLKGDSMISNYKELYLEIAQSSNSDGAKVGCEQKTGRLNQMWSFNSKERVYFIVKGKQSGKVLDVPSNLAITIWSYNGGDHQLWFWDKDSIRSKKYPDKVIDLHMDDYKRNNWGKIYMHAYNGGENQKWSIDGDYIVSGFRQLVIDVLQERTYNGAKVGGNRRRNSNNQKWEISLPSGNQATSCVDKTEEDIYNVVQWIPLVSTLWDLFSSIGYAAAGCTSIANERGISFAIGGIMDVATIATGGAASAATSVIKTGVKAGIRYGLKQGMKSAVRFTKQSIQNVVRKTITKIGSNGLLSTLKSGIKKAGKLLVRETIVEPAKFLKNTGKISKKILTHPRRTLKQTWKAASESIDNLKQLKKRYRALKHGETPSFDEFSTVGKARCKRGPIFSCIRPNVDKGYSKTQQKMYHELLKEQTNSPTIEKCAQRYMKIKGSSFDKDLASAPEIVRNKMDAMTTELEKAELFATYKYTVNPNVNLYAQNILDKKPLLDKALLTERFPDMTDRAFKRSLRDMAQDADENLYQATLMQSYLKRNPIDSPQTVLRYEDIKFTGHLYENDKIYTSNKFLSTTKKTDRFRDAGLDLTNTKKYNTELTIHLKKSGTDVSAISKYPDQEEVLIPIGTRFNVKRFDPDANGITKVILTELD